MGLAVAIVLAALATMAIERIVEARYPVAGRFVSLTGGRLHVVEAGPATGEADGVVVLLHGASSGWADLMLPLGSRLAGRFRVVAFDRPGHGRSDRIAGSEAATPERQAAIIAEALRRLGIDRGLILGHSWAGAVVARLALDHPDVIAAAFFLAPVSHPWPGGGVSWYYGPAASPALGRLLTHTVTAPLGLALMWSTVRRVFAPQPPPAGYIDDARIPLVLRPAAFRANAEDVAGLYEAVAAQSPHYPAIRVPTTVLAGEADAIVWTRIHALGLARDIPQARLVVLPGIGHMPHHAAPGLIVSEIEALARRAGLGARPRAATAAAPPAGSGR